VTTSTPAPPPRKPIALFALHAAVLALLIGFWPTPRALYPEFVRAHAGAVLSLGREGSVSLRANADLEDGADTVMEELSAGARAPRWRAELSTLSLGWWPFAVLAALLLATPMAARRRAIALAAAFLWVEAYVLLRLLAGAGYADYEASAGAAGKLLGPMHAALRTATSVLEANGVLVAVVLLGWVVLARPADAFDTSSLRRLLPRSPRRA
jgi:hypothetical protein